MQHPAQKLSKTKNWRWHQMLRRQDWVEHSAKHAPEQYMIEMLWKFQKWHQLQMHWDSRFKQDYNFSVSYLSTRIW